MTRKKLFIGAAIVVVLAAIGYANFAFHRTSSTAVTVEKILPRDLEAIVSASGKVQPKRQVDISAETMGKIVALNVQEGDSVKAGQPLLEIDPRNLQMTVDNHEASLATAHSLLEETRSQVENARVALQQSQDAFRRQEQMWKAGLQSRDQYDIAAADLKTRETNLSATEQSVRTQEQRIKQEEALLESAKTDLSKVRIVSPITGIVTKRNVEEGETAVVGTMNNAGTVLLSVADMSVIETEIEVDETDVPYVKIGQPAQVSIDAIPDKKFPGHVTEVGNSPIASTSTTTQRATNFKIVVTLDGTVPNVRPGFTCTADITTATRQNALSVPIQAMTVRELVVDAKGQIVKTPPAVGRSQAPGVLADLLPGQSRKEIEGAFVVEAGKAVFVPVKTGIAGEKYFEVLSGLKAGDEVITGPFASVRGLREGDAVTISKTAASTTPTGN